MAHSNVQVFDAAFGAYKARFADLQLKAMELTQTNMNAAFAFARKALAVKEPAEFFSLQQDFVKDQFQLAQKQATELNELAVALAKETVKPVQEGLTKTFGDVTKSYAA
jgi:phasin family protein